MKQAEHILALERDLIIQDDTYKENCVKCHL